MTAKDRFDCVMKRCDDLLALYDDELHERCGKKNDDLLRSAVVLGVAGMERYVKDSFFENLITYLKHGKVNSTLKERLEKAGVDNGFLLSEMANDNKDGLYLSIKDKVVRSLEKEVFQRVDAIVGLFKCFDLKDVVESAVGRAKKEYLWKSIERFIKRRHQIAHAADFRLDGEMDAIDEMYTKDGLSSIKEFTDSLDSILLNKFSLRKKLRGLKVGTAMQYLKAGMLDARRHVCVRRIDDILKLLNVQAKRRGFLMPGCVEYPKIPEAEVWWPRISETPNYVGWKNVVGRKTGNDIHEIIEENVADEKKNKETLRYNIRNDRLRIVFANIEGTPCDSGYCYQFLGLFRIDKEASKRRNACIWTLVDSCLKL